MSFFNADMRVTGNDGLILKDLDAHATTPGSGLGTLYYHGGTVYIQNTAGTTTSLSGGGGGGSTAADDITVGDSTVNISTTSGSIIMHSVNNASNSIVMTSNSGANETIEVHNIQGTNSASILLKSYYGGTTLEGLSTNLNNDPGILAISRSTPTSNGSGFAPIYFNSFITDAFGDKVTTFQIDAQNLVVANNSVSNLSVVVGKNNSTNSFFGRYEESKMGTIYKMEMICIETPTPEIGPDTEVGFAQAGMYTGYNLSNGTTYSTSGGYGGGLTVSFDLTEHGGIKEIFVIDAGSGYDPADPISVTSDDTIDTYYFNYFPSDRRVTISTNDASGTSSNNSNISTTNSFGSIPPGSGLTVDLKSVVLSGTYYYYGVSVNNTGSGYSSGDILSSNDLNYTFDLIVTTGSVNTYSLGSNSNILSTGETDILNLSTSSSNTTVSKLSTIPLTVPTTLVNNDYFYLTFRGQNSSNTTITAGKFLIKMYGSSF